jgi:hypothetical protein
MSQVEALLSVDAGKVPAGTFAFFPRDPDAPARKLFGVFAALADIVALILVVRGIALPGAAVLGLIGLAFAVAAFPTKPDPADTPIKKPTLVLTPDGMIVRDGTGLRSWRFEDLIEVTPYLHYRTLGLLLVCRDGRRDFVDTQFFERGDKVRELVGRRLKPRAV